MNRIIKWCRGQPVLIIALSFVSCLIPYKPVAKIKETKDKNGDKVYTVYRYRE